MNILPPLHIIKSWRDEGLSPAEVYYKCEEYAKYRRLAKLRFCSKCPAIYYSKGLCKKHYYQQKSREYRQREKLKMLNNM